jgi:DUF4097 and DUF4098 domain-containing protein YvlB
MRSAVQIAWRAALPLAALLASAAVHADSERNFDRKVAAQPRGVVDISNVSGEIEVTGWDRPEVSVHGELSAGVERVDVTSEAARTIIKVVVPSHSTHGGGADLHVQIPKDSELVITAVSADITTTGVQGVQRLSTVSSEITAEVFGADLELKSVSGDVKVTGHGQPAQMHLSTVSGDLSLEHGAGDLEARTVSGALNVSLDSARAVHARSTSGDVHLSGRLTHGATLDASTVSGNLKLRTSAEGGYSYEASTFSGDISDCFEVKPERTSQYAPGSTLQGTRGEGAGHVHLKTLSGNIELCDRH